jgi:predicted ATPase/DNA-binding CsgD family transcriptional regulator
MPALDTETQRDKLRSVPHNVPVQLTSLVGREREVAAICELLSRDDIRLVTLTGAPGIGKTRLGIEVANTLRGAFGDGIYFVSLASVTDPDEALQAVASAFGIRQIGDQSLEEVLSRFLSGKQVLLLLDNFEQVLIAGPAVTQMLKAAPGLKVLATSRELLRLSGEHDFPVPALSLPPVLTPQGDSGRYTPLPPESLGDYEAVQLFVQRAVAYRPDFVLSEENAYIVAAICRKLDGLPLAIELASPRIRHLSPQAILDRLQDRLALLTGGAIDLPLRQRTLRATIEWSYGLLSEDEKRLFRRLAVFRGARTLEAIEAVCDSDRHLGVEPLTGVASLVDKSLLQQATAMGTAEVVVPRYVMLETIQEYAKGKLEESGEAEALYKAHAIYFTQLAERAEPELHGPQQVEWLDRLESEQNNLQAALGWAYRNSFVDVGLRLVAALNIYWNRRGYLIEGREWASGIVSKARETGMKSVLERSASALLPLEGQMQASMARALYTLGLIAFRQANYLSARDLLDESVQIYKQLRARGDRGDTRGLVESLNVLGIVTSRLENMPARRSLHEQALELARQVGDNWSIARSLYQLGHVARHTGDPAFGRSLFEESLVLFKESGDKFNIALALIGLGQMAERQRDYQSAQRFFEQALSIFKELGDKWGISGALYCLGCVHIGLRDYTSAMSALEENLALTEELGTSGDGAETLEKLGKAAYFQGDYESAHLLYKRSLSLSQELWDKMGITRCLIDLAGVLAVATSVKERQAKGKGAADKAMHPAPTVSAARLLGTAQVLLGTVGFQVDPEDQELFNGYIAAARTQLSEQTFGMAWAEGRAMTIDQAIAYAQAVPAPSQSDASEHLPSPHRATGSEFSGLTRREREVATLVSQGKSNRQIAAELVVSERTVEGHVNNILSKLGFRSRAQVAAWAVEKGLP